MKKKNLKILQLEKSKIASMNSKFTYLIIGGTVPKGTTSHSITTATDTTGTINNCDKTKVTCNNGID